MKDGNSSDSGGLPKTMRYCPDCGKAISKNAETCPNCGRRLKASGNSNVGGFGIFVAIVLAGITVWAIMNPYSMPVWLQKIVFQIKALFEGKDSYTILNWDKAIP